MWGGCASAMRATPPSRQARRCCWAIGLIRCAEASDAEWGARTAINLPALTTTVAEMAKALEKAAGAQVASLIDWTPDPVISKIVLSWPVRVSAERAKGLGLLPDADFASIINEYLS